MFQQLQNSINLQALEVKRTMGEVKSSLNALRTEMFGTQRQLQKLLTQMEAIATNIKQTEARVAEMECQNVSLLRDITKQELEVTAYNIRIQIILQETDEDIYKIVADRLGPLVNYSTEEMSKELDYAYRTLAAITRCTNVPPEIVV